MPCGSPSRGDRAARTEPGRPCLWFRLSFLRLTGARVDRCTPAERLRRAASRGRLLLALTRLVISSDEVGRSRGTIPSSWSFTSRHEVSGHFKLQPHGPQRSAMRRLVWVDGYNVPTMRQARKCRIAMATGTVGSAPHHEQAYLPCRAGCFPRQRVRSASAIVGGGTTGSSVCFPLTKKMPVIRRCLSLSRVSLSAVPWNESCRVATPWSSISTPFRGPSADAGARSRNGLHACTRPPDLRHTNDDRLFLDRCRLPCGGALRQRSTGEHEDPDGMAIEPFELHDQPHARRCRPASGGCILLRPHSGRTLARRSLLSGAASRERR